MADGGEDDSASELDEWVLPRCGSVPPLVFIGPVGSRQGCQETRSQPTAGATASPAGAHDCNGGLLLIFPGGGYRKVEMEKEGRAVARHFASQGFVCCVVDYQLAPFATFSVRAATAQPSLADAVAALAFVQTDTASGVGKVFQANRIALMGFSAGGHLSLCLLREVARAAAGPKPGELGPEPEPEPTAKPGLQVRPPVAALLLVYPTIRNPSCWCIAGGLWILPGSIGANWPANAEHVSIACHVYTKSDVRVSVYQKLYLLWALCVDRPTACKALPRCESCYRRSPAKSVQLPREATCCCQLTSTQVCWLMRCESMERFMVE